MALCDCQQRDQCGIMKLNIIDEKSGSVTNDGTAKNSRGGTELMRERLFNSMPEELLDKVQIISSRVREVDPNKPSILWLHDCWDDPEAQHLADPASRERFEALVFVSNYQQQTYNMGLGVPYDCGLVIKNGIVPIPEHTKPDGPINLIYHTTPHRGLEILVPVYEQLYANYGDDIHLDVYSSFSIYGRDQNDIPYKSLFEQCMNHPGITYHGAVSNEEVRGALQKAHIYAYPCIWLETSCLSAIEAMSAGCDVVYPSIGALPETLGGMGVPYAWSEELSVHANRFAMWLDAAIREHRSENTSARLEFQKVYANAAYDWETVAEKWKMFLEGCGV